VSDHSQIHRRVGEGGSPFPVIPEAILQNLLAITLAITERLMLVDNVCWHLLALPSASRC
jgi:hypothetical protein